MPSSSQNVYVPDKIVDSVSDEKPTAPERETWGKKVEFLLAVIGFAVDLGNVWRFPYICYKNGGGAFLIPYFLMMFLLGMPLFYMELALGQFHRSGPITIWTNICPMFRGIGYAICLVSSLVGMYYNTIIAYAVFYMFASFRASVPWASCDNEWNSPNCLAISDYNTSQQNNESMSSAAEYFLDCVLEIKKSNGIEDIGMVKWQLTLCLLAVFVMIYFALWKGVKSTGMVVWVTATVPYIILLVLLVRGCTLPGAKNGILYYLRPQWDKLLKIEVWVDAAAQICFSLGPGFGTLIALSSYNKFHNNCYLDAMATSVINCMTSLLAGFVVFSVLGYMAFLQNKTVDSVAIDGPGLVFIVYPEAIASMHGAVFWAIIFFLMLITLGLDSAFGGLEAVITGVCDAYPMLKKHREIVVGLLIGICFLCSLPSTTYGGQYVMHLFDIHAAPKSLLIICFCEVIGVNWFYGVNNFCKDVETMLGFQPGIYWRICWVFIAPICLLALFILSIVFYPGMELNGYVYPDWAVAIGWIMSCSSIVCIPAYIGYSFLTNSGSLYERLLCMIHPSGSRDRKANGAVDLVSYSKCRQVPHADAGL